MPVQAQYLHAGRVLADNGSCIPGARVCEGISNCVVSDSLGRFSLLANRPEIILSVYRAGHQPEMHTFRQEDTLLIVRISPIPVFSEVTVQAFDTRLRIKEVPAAVGILTRSDLARFNNTGFVAAVNTMPGVKMDERSPGSFRLSIRGNLLRSPFGIRNVKMYWDGIPFTDAGGTTYFNQVDFQEIGRMEIIRGPVGSLYGAGTGGTLLLYSAMPDSNTRSVSVNMLGGLYGMAGLSAAFSVRQGGQASVLRISHLQSDGWRQHTCMQRDKIFHSGTYRTGKKSELRSLLFYSRLAYQTPGGLTLRQQDSSARQSRPATASFPSAAVQQTGVSLHTLFAGFSHQHAFSSRWSNTTAVYISATRTRNPALLNYQEKNERGIGGRSLWRYHTARLQFHLGAEYQYTFTESGTFGNKQGMPDTLQANDEIGSRQTSVFMQALYRLHADWSLQAGLSYNRFSYRFIRLNRIPPSSSYRLFPPQLVPRLSLVRQIDKRFSVFIAVSNGYSPPTIDEVVPSTGQFNASLLAETALNTEAGLRMNLLGGRLQGELSVYRLQLGNTIVLQRDAAGADYFLNAGGTRQHGLELAMQYAFPLSSGSLLTRAVARMALTLQQARFTEYKRGVDDFSGNRLPGVPRGVVVAGCDLGTRNRYNLNVTLNHTGNISLNDANTALAPGYLLLHLRAGKEWKLGKRLIADVFAVVDNSLNRPFSLGNDLNAAGGRFYNPSAPFQFTTGVSFRWLFPAGQE